MHRICSGGPTLQSYHKICKGNVTITVICNRFRYCRGPWNDVYTTRDSPEQPHMIVVTHKKLLKVERGHRATRWCNIVGIQRIYGMFTCPKLPCPTLESSLAGALFNMRMNISSFAIDHCLNIATLLMNILSTHID